jgi:hypothetical protein
MRKSISLLCLFISAITACAVAQPTSINESFSQSNHGWILGGGAQISNYRDPSDDCENSKGIVADAPTLQNPVTLTSPSMLSNGATSSVITFNIFRMDNLSNCNNWSDFNCPIYISYQIETGGNVLATTSNILLPSIGPGKPHKLSLRLNTAGILNTGNIFKVTLKLSHRNSTPGCENSNTKIILDDISVCQESSAVGIDAINDEGITYEGAGSETYNGNLSSNDNHAGSTQMNYSIAKGPLGINKSIPGGANLIINNNGSFTITRTDPTVSVFEFSYRMKNNNNGKTDLASAKIYFASSGPLPLSLLSFTAVRKNNTVFVQWNTSNESNLNVFEVQRKVNGSFTNVGKVVANNNAGQTQYQFSEINTSNLISEYRLKILENNGTYRYSEIAVIKGLERKIEWMVIPNPNNGIGQIHFNETLVDATLEMIDNTGRCIRKHQNLNGQNHYFNDVKPGVYMLRLTQGKMVATQKMIVQ